MRVINPIMVTVNLMSASRAKIAIIAYLMVEMGKTQDQIQSETSLEKTALIIQF